DLHWKINNSELLSRLFSWEELRREAVPLPALSPHALAASAVHALLIACMHRSTHRQNPYYVNGEPHHDANRRVWLYDIHLLSIAFGPAEWETFTKLAAEKGLRSVCLEGLQRAQTCFHTAYPQSVLVALAQPGRREPVARYLHGGKLEQLWMDFCALGSVSRQLRWIGETLIPSAA